MPLQAKQSRHQSVWNYHVALPGMALTSVGCVARLELSANGITIRSQRQRRALLSTNPIALLQPALQGIALGCQGADFAWKHHAFGLELQVTLELRC